MKRRPQFEIDVTSIIQCDASRPLRAHAGERHSLRPGEALRVQLPAGAAALRVRYHYVADDARSRSRLRAEETEAVLYEVAIPSAEGGD